MQMCKWNVTQCNIMKWNVCTYVVYVYACPTWIQNPRMPSLLSQMDSISFSSAFSFSPVPFSAWLPQENFTVVIVQTFVTTKWNGQGLQTVIQNDSAWRLCNQPVAYRSRHREFCCLSNWHGSWKVLVQTCETGSGTKVGWNACNFIILGAEVKLSTSQTALITRLNCRKALKGT